MLENILLQRNCSLKVKITVKTLISVGLIILAVVLPQIAHLAGGSAAGSIWMPMYAPVLLAGCLLGWRWGIGVGILSPLVSFAFTALALGSAMPAAERLPYMILELGVFGLVSGLFSNKINKNAWMAFLAVLLAQVAGRAAYVIYNLIAGRNFAALWASVKLGLVGLYLQAVVVPLIVIGLQKLLDRDKEKE